MMVDGTLTLGLSNAPGKIDDTINMKEIVATVHIAAG